MKTKFICISGFARVGKDTLANLLLDFLIKRDYNVVTQPLAFPLKSDCNDFLEDAFNISAFTQDTEEKAFIRDYLVVVGSMRRKRSQGTYYTNMLLQEVKLFTNPEPDFVIVPDVRYADPIYPDDELVFFQKLNSYIITVHRIKENGELVGPANKDEEINTPRIQSWANAVLTWETSGGVITDEMKSLAENLGQKILHFYGVQY